MSRISASQRQAVIERAHSLCEYCQSAQIINVFMEIDHINPVVAGGLTELENLCLTCAGCNGFKQDFTTGIDPKTNQTVDLFNPRTQNWTDHFQWNENCRIIVGLTPTGRVTINRLRMNRHSISILRRMWVELGWQPPAGDRFKLLD